MTSLSSILNVVQKKDIGLSETGSVRDLLGFRIDIILASYSVYEYVIFFSAYALGVWVGTLMTVRVWSSKWILELV